jgi:hypothetical protein
MKTVMTMSGLALALSAASMGATAIERLDLSNGVGVCQGALPAFEGQLRKRPTAISNEGTAGAFVSCSTTQNWFAEEPAEEIGLVITNNTLSPVTVQCTMVAGIKYVGFMSPMLFPKSFTVPGGETVEDGWTTADNGGQAFPASLNTSCNLPPGVEIGSVYIYIADDGAAPAQ